MRKRRLLILMGILQMSIQAFALQSQYIIGGIRYHVLNSSVQIPTLAVYQVQDAAVDASGHVTIPDYVQIEKDVTGVVTTIGGIDDYSSSSKLKSVTLPSTVTTLSNYSFKDSGIQTLEIPASVTSVTSGTSLYYMRSLATITVADDNPNYEAEDNILYTKGKKALIHVPSKKSFSSTDGVYSINENVTSIWTNAINTNTSITKLIIPKNVSNINEGFSSFCPGGLQESGLH